MNSLKFIGENLNRNFSSVGFTGSFEWKKVQLKIQAQSNPIELSHFYLKYSIQSSKNLSSVGQSIQFGS